VTIPVPEIAIEQPVGVDRPDHGTTFSLGNVQIGTTADFVFTIKNVGTLPLNLTGTPKVALTGANMSLFSVTVDPPAQVAASSSATFTLRFAPDTTGVKAVALSIANDDADENPYQLSLTATATDTITLSPTLTAPANNSTVSNPLNVSFTLPEAA